MTTFENPSLLPEKDSIVLDSHEPLPRVVAPCDTVFVVNAGKGELAVGDDAVINLAPDKRIEVNKGTQYQVLWGEGLDLTLEYS